MSFILDALRRAETARGAQPQPVAAPTALDAIAAPVHAPAWRRPVALLAVAVLGVAVGAILWRSGGETPAQTPADRAAATAAPAVGPVAQNTPLAEVATPPQREIRGLDQVARETAAPARAEAPPAQRRGSVTLAQQPLAADDVAVRQVGNVATPPEQVPSYASVLLSGRANLPPFHLDIHVYSERPARRFVFVNNRKYREGDALAEGGSVERITPTGVILNHRGHRFELAPD